VTTRRTWGLAALLTLINLIAGCALPIRANVQNDANVYFWKGRLALRVHADPAEVKASASSFSAPFELQGNALQGELVLFTPLGSTAAAILWAPGKAVLQARGEDREFGNLSQLIRELLGTDVPVAALFAWLNGQAQEVNSWQVDLSQRSQGKILARRVTPAPFAELRLVLDN
jgi:outer membrane lipoprotein LolB